MVYIYTHKQKYVGIYIYYTYTYISRSSLKVRLVENFLSAEEAERIIALGVPRMARSRAGNREESVRTSTTAMLPAGDPTVAAITRRASALTGYPVEHIEPLQLVRYTEGQK